MAVVAVAPTRMNLGAKLFDEQASEIQQVLNDIHDDFGFIISSFLRVKARVFTVPKSSSEQTPNRVKIGTNSEQTVQIK